MNTGSALPRLLLVEDDPVSREFLSSAAATLPASVDAVDTIAAAIACSAPGSHDLWLFDANLPDGSGGELLRTLRAFDTHTPALAHTASRHRADLDALIAAGFGEVLIKPLGIEEWQAAIRRALGQPAETPASATQLCGKRPVWNDEAALAALNGNAQHVAALRDLFLCELPSQREAVSDALQMLDHASAHDVLHRLKASCGFVGASRLLAAVELLDATCDAASASRFYDAVDDTLSSV
ncbi:MAG: response regulator [Luteimonas sp.]